MDADNSFDWETYVFFPIFALGASASLGLISADILPWFGLGDVWLETGNIEWTAGRLLAAGALVAVMVNRNASIQDTKGIDLWVAYVTLGLVLAPPFFPAFEGWITEGPAAWVSFTVQSIGFAVVTYIN